MSTGMVVIMVVAMICATLIVLVKLTSDHPTPKMCAACGHKTADHDGPCKVCYCPGVTTPGSWGLR